jgi:hypothetical protein
MVENQKDHIDKDICSFLFWALGALMVFYFTPVKDGIFQMFNENPCDLLQLANGHGEPFSHRPNVIGELRCHCRSP